MKYLTTYNKFNESKFDDFKQDVKDICLEITDYNKFSVSLSVHPTSVNYTSDYFNNFRDFLSTQRQKGVKNLGTIFIKLKDLYNNDGFSSKDVSEVVLRLVDFLGDKYLKVGINYIGDSEMYLFDDFKLSDAHVRGYWNGRYYDPAKISSIIIFYDIYSLNESKSESTSKLKFTKQPKKKGAKTDVYNVSNGGKTIGQVRWSSRMRGYAFLPTKECEPEIKEFVKELMRKRREDK